MPALERVRIRSVDLDPEDYPYETPKEVQGATHKLASRQLEHALDLHLSRRRPAGRYALLGDQGLYRRGGGDPQKTLAPDVIVYLQAPDLQGRQSFVLEADGPPDLVMEILSKKTWEQDVKEKRGQYAAMGIGEYWIYDPQGHRPRGEPRVQGFRQAGGRYAEIAPTAPRAWNGVRDPGPLWRSEVLQTAWGLDARGALRLQDPQTGDWYPTLAEHDRQFLPAAGSWTRRTGSWQRRISSWTRRISRSRNSRPYWLATKSHAIPRRESCNRWHSHRLGPRLLWRSPPFTRNRISRASQPDRGRARLARRGVQSAPRPQKV